MITTPRAVASRFYLAFDPEYKPENCQMKFRLTYEGRLEANGSAQHKHEIRQALHPQLRHLWATDPNLQKWIFIVPPESKLPRAELPNTAKKIDILAQDFERCGYHFVPLATSQSSLIAAIDILFLRPDQPGGIIQSGDIDNRLKTLFDGLKMPASKEELGPYTTPRDDEEPFYVLLEDDRLLSHVSIETDVLLQPTPSANGIFLVNDCRLIITVTLRPYHVNMQNLHFA